MLAVLRAIEARPAIETARRVRQRMSAVFVYGIASGVCPMDPAAIVQGAMAPLIKGRQPAIVDLGEARDVLRRAEAVPAHPVTKLALRMIALTAVRPGEIRGAAWHEFEQLDGSEPLWRIPATRMKMKQEHLVPLSQQAVAVIMAARSLTGRGPLVFPNARHAHRPMSENAIGYLLNRAGYHSRHVPHGWRATFSTIMNESYRDDRHVIDLMLAHAPKDKTEAAYNRASHMPRRRELVQEWADMLLKDAPDAALLVHGPRRGYHAVIRERRAANELREAALPSPSVLLPGTGSDERIAQPDGLNDLAARPTACSARPIVHSSAMASACLGPREDLPAGPATAGPRLPAHGCRTTGETPLRAACTSECHPPPARTRHSARV